ncbi:MAG: cytochrome c biogenesis protein CcsA [Sandaracinaceae bacterium]|nr:cytochrome c biogenesis protein CcsA [Myxococcales bacterium]MCB9657377.1 cytochrome c biogenesis protein CcsA [Sandaracinaceae bacterium]
MLISGLFITTAVLYGIACALYLAHLTRGRAGLTRATNAALGAAVGLHVAYLVSDIAAGHTSFTDIYRVLSLVSFAIVAVFLASTLRRPVTVLGAFITPVTLLFFLASGLGHSVDSVSPEVRSRLLPFHVAVNVLGVSAFALAFGAALAYVLQERLLRRKELGGVFQRLPALDVLDSLSFRASLVGFSLLTIGVVTGALWVVREHASQVMLAPAPLMGIATWWVFASILGLRVMSGWRGRRAALGTIVGFLCAVSVLAFYALRAGSVAS